MGASHSDLGLFEHFAHRAQILGEGGLDEGLGAEGDQRYPVAVARLDEPSDHPLDRLESLDARAVLGDEVVLIHRARDIDGEDHVTRRLGDFDRLADALGARQCGHQKRPDQDGNNHLQPLARQHYRPRSRLGARRPGDMAEERKAQRRYLLALWRGKAPDQPWRRQQQQRPGEGQFNHDVAPCGR